jgi:hypothetical protein
MGQRGTQGEVRRFANDCAGHAALGKALLAKTDRIDAQGLAHFSSVRGGHGDVRRYTAALPDANQLALRALVVNMRVTENNHLNMGVATATKSIKAMIKSINTQLRNVDDEIAARSKRTAAGWPGSWWRC